MKSKERLLELLCNVECKGDDDYWSCPSRTSNQCRNIQRLDMCMLSAIANHLLASGVIVPPFPVGTTYYRIVERTGKHKGRYFIIREAVLNYYNIDNVIRDIGRTVFLAREEAEKALKERSENGK